MSIPPVNPYANYYGSNPPTATAAPVSGGGQQNIYHQAVTPTLNTGESDAKSMHARAIASSSSSSAAAAASAMSDTATAAAVYAASTYASTFSNFNAAPQSQTEVKMRAAQRVPSTAARAISTSSSAFAVTLLTSTATTATTATATTAPASTVISGNAGLERYKRHLVKYQGGLGPFSGEEQPGMRVLSDIQKVLSTVDLVCMDPGSIDACKRILTEMMDNLENPDLVSVENVVIYLKKAVIYFTKTLKFLEDPLCFSEAYKTTLATLNYLLHARIALAKASTLNAQGYYQNLANIQTESGLLSYFKKCHPDFMIFDIPVTSLGSWESDGVMQVTALGACCYYGDISRVRSLLKMGANPNFAVSEGDTPGAAVKIVSPAWYALFISPIKSTEKQLILNEFNGAAEVTLQHNDYNNSNWLLSEAIEFSNFRPQDMHLALRGIKELQDEELTLEQIRKFSGDNENSLLYNLFNNLSNKLNMNVLLDLYGNADEANDEDEPVSQEGDDKALKDHAVQHGAVIISNGGWLRRACVLGPDHYDKHPNPKSAFERRVNFNGTPRTLLEIERIRERLLADEVSEELAYSKSVRTILDSDPQFVPELNSIVVSYIRLGSAEINRLVSQKCFDLLFPVVPARPTSSARLSLQGRKKRKL